MGTIQNLDNREGAAKLKELAEDIRICMFCTNLGHTPFGTRPMALQEVDEHGGLWFLSSASSEKNTEIRQDDHVQLLFAKPASAQFLSVYGQADIFRDKEKTEALWTPIAKAWFKEGKDDPDVTIIRVRPSESYYWDTKDGKMFTMIRLAVAALTGKEADGGIQGRIGPA